MSKEVKIPENIRELTKGYIPIDFKLMPEEEIYSVLKMKLSSKIRDFIVVLLIGLLGYSLYIFFNSKLSVYDALPPIIIFLTTYFIWHYRITRDIKHLFWNILKYSFYLLLIGYGISFLASYLKTILEAFTSTLGLENLPTPKFSLNPVENTYALIEYILDLLRGYIIRYRDILGYGSIALVIIALIAIPLIYFYVRGRRYYITNKRVIVRQKFGTIQVTTLPIDGIMEVTAFQGLFGRIFKYGDVIISMTSGSGVLRSLTPEDKSISSGLYRVKRKIEGIENPWDVKDLIIKLREEYIEAQYLKRIEEELKAIKREIKREEIEEDVEEEEDREE